MNSKTRSSGPSPPAAPDFAQPTAEADTSLNDLHLQLQ